jgi:HD-GYP domain-containing protein (c-di-GMP phosphodiesterase class II)
MSTANANVVTRAPATGTPGTGTGTAAPPQSAPPLAGSGDARLFLDTSREALQQVAVLLRNSYLHDLGNQVFEEPLEKLSRSIGRLLASEGSFRLERAGQEFFVNGARLRMEFRNLQAYKYVIRELDKRELGGFLFEKKLGTDELTTMLEVLSSPADGSQDRAAVWNRALAERGITGVKLLEPLDEADIPDDLDEADRREKAITAYQQALEFIRDSMATLDSPAQVNLRKAKRTVQKLVDLSYEEGDGFSLAGLASIKDHHDYTFNHMINVCVLAIAFGQRLGLTRQSLAQLGLCALYHDMGKLHIPLEILDKKRGLSEEEWAVMGNHTVYAARTLFPLIEVDRSAAQRILTALQHHLRYDGEGYPALHLRRKQSLFARITAIVDTFDAMTTKRIYQRQYLPDQAIAVMVDGAGTKYDPLLVKAFVNCMGIFPVGSTVALTSGEIAVVVESNPDPDHIHQPKVRLVKNASDQFVAPVLVDLSLPEHGGRQAHHCVDPEQHGINSAHYVV